MKQTFSTGQTLLSSEMNTLQANDYNWTVSEKNTSYQLAAADKGTRVVMNAGTATTITVPNSTFDAGDTVWLHSIGSGTVNVAAGTGVTLNTAASTALAQWEGGSLYFTSGSSAIFFRGGGVSPADFSNTPTNTYSSGGFSYKFVTFTGSGTLTTTRAGFADILVLGGGGGGGNVGGGGGAGGHLLITDAYLPAGSLTVTVGGGGSGATASLLYAPGYNGTTSRLGNYYGVGGGGGGGSGLSQGVGDTGGSGGGGGSGSTSYAGGAGVGGQGSNGGSNNNNPSNYGAGGGGGSSAVGGNGTSTTGGTGGAGTSSSLDNVATTRGGGGGGGSQGGTAGGGGSGGGGAGTNNNTTATGGTVNTGGGGGGGGFASGNGAAGGNGGSGIVIIRVKV
jgi:hypothetical protein